MDAPTTGARHEDEPSAVPIRAVDVGILRALVAEGKCRAAPEAARSPEGLVCPACGSTARICFDRGGLRYWQCGSCGPQCSLISGPIFEASKLSLTRWFLTLQLLSQAKNNVSALELMRQSGVSYRSAKLVKHQIMEGLLLREDRRELYGRVEMDDAYVGGERSSGRTGQGSDNNVPIVAAVQTTSSGLDNFGARQGSCRLGHAANAV